MSTALVTGSSGFIGSHLVEFLQDRGTTTFAMVRKTSNTKNLAGRTVDYRYGDVGGVDGMVEAMEGVDTVYHVAGMTAGRQAQDYNLVNGQGTANVFEAAKKAKRGPSRVVYVSSLAAGGPSHPEVARREHHRPEPVSIYGKSKALGEEAAWAAAQDGALEVVIVRPPAVYGPRDEDFAQVIDLASKGLALTVGYSDSYFSIVHCNDLVRGIVLAAERGKALPRGAAHALGGAGTAFDQIETPDHPAGQGIYYFTDGSRSTWAQLGHHSASACGRKAITIAIPVSVAWALGYGSELVGRMSGIVPIFSRDKVREGSASGWWADHSKAAAELGYVPEWSLERGLLQTVEWLRGQKMVK